MNQGPRELYEQIGLDQQAHPLTIDDDAVLDLLWLSYAASMNSDENRFPRLLLFVPVRTEGAVYSQFMPFEPPLPLSVDTLRRLAAGIPARPHGLMVKQAGAGLVVPGTVIPEFTGYVIAPGRRSWFQRNAHTIGLFVEILGPGHLLVTDMSRQPFVAYRLRSCAVTAVWDVTVTAPFTMTVDGVMTFTPTHGGVFGREGLRQFVESFLARLLQIAVAGRHGGAFAIVPDGFDHTQSPLIANARIAVPPLREGFIALVRAVLEDPDTDWDGEAVFRAIGTSRQYARSIGQLAAIDGTVLLSRGLAVLGAGVITTGGRLPTCVHHDHAAGASGPFAIEALGSRNQSAARFCAASKATLFLASEDGDLRVYFPCDDGSVGVIGDVGFLAGSSPVYG